MSVRFKCASTDEDRATGSDLGQGGVSVQPDSRLPGSLYDCLSQNDSSNFRHAPIFCFGLLFVHLCAFLCVRTSHSVGSLSPPSILTTAHLPSQPPRIVSRTSATGFPASLTAPLAVSLPSRLQLRSTPDKLRLLKSCLRESEEIEKAAPPQDGVGEIKVAWRVGCAREIPKLQRYSDL